MKLEQLRESTGPALPGAIADYLSAWKETSGIDYAIDLLRGEDFRAASFQPDGSAVLRYHSRRTTHTELDIELAAPFRGEIVRDRPLPASYERVIRMHNGVRIVGPRDTELVVLCPFDGSRIVCDVEAPSANLEPFFTSKERYAFAFDHDRPRAGGEPAIVPIGPGVTSPEPLDCGAAELVLRYWSSRIYGE